MAVDQFKISFLENIKMHRREMSKNRRKNFMPKPTNWAYPFALEIEYTKLIRKYALEPLYAAVEEELENNLENWIDEAKQDSIKKLSFLQKIGKALGFRSDQEYPTQIQSLIARLRAITRQGFPDSVQESEQSEVYQELLVLAVALNIFNTRQWKKATQKVTGFSWSTDQSWWDNVKTAWAKQNYSLIKSRSEEYITRLNEIVYRGIREGKRAAELKEEIKALELSMSKTRSELLAHDQIGKLYAKVSELQQTEAGIEIYQWQTAHDERVRGRPKPGIYPNSKFSHWDMEGKWCQWSDRTVYADPPANGEEPVWQKRKGRMPNAHPGEQIRCRCTALAIMRPLIEEADKQIEEREPNAI